LRSWCHAIDTSPKAYMYLAYEDMDILQKGTAPSAAVFSMCLPRDINILSLVKPNARVAVALVQACS
jgi:hypothetical protein